MLYGCEVWGYYVIREIEILYKKYFIHILGVHKNTYTVIVYGDLGIYPVEIYIKTRMISYWIRLITGKPGKLASVMYQCLMYLHSVGHYTSPWLKEIASILNKCGMSGIWLSQEIMSLVWLRKL